MGYGKGAPPYAASPTLIPALPTCHGSVYDFFVVAQGLDSDREPAHLCFTCAVGPMGRQGRKGLASEKMSGKKQEYVCLQATPKSLLAKQLANFREHYAERLARASE